MLFGRTKIFFTFNNVCFLDLYPNIIMPTCFNCSLKSKMAAHQRIRQYVSDIANRSFQDIHGEDMACFPIFRYTHTYSQQQAKISTIYFSYPLKAIGLIAESSKNSLVRERLNFNVYDVLQCLTYHKGSLNPKRYNSFGRCALCITCSQSQVILICKLNMNSNWILFVCGNTPYIFRC